jgi:hypothetical protein
VNDREPIEALARLKDELLRAGSNHASMADVWTGPASGPPGPHRRRGFGWLGLAIGSGLAVVVALAAVLVLAGHRGQVRHPATQPDCTQQLLAQLAVLRRPQTAADRAFHAPPIPGGASGREDRFPFVSVPALTRLARTLPNGSRVFLAVYAPVPGGVDAPLGDLAFVFVAGREGGTPTLEGEVSAAVLDSPPQFPAIAPGGVWLSVVPDRVTRVRWTFPREQLPDRPALLHARSGHVFPATTVTAQVVGNIAAANVNRRAFLIPSGTTWLGLKGQPIKTVRYPTIAQQIKTQGTLTSEGMGIATPIRCASR